MEFGEKYLPKLVLKADDDEFKRPSHTWSYDKKDIGSYVDYDLLEGEFTVAVDGRDLYNLLGKSVIEDNDVVYYHNGKESSVIEAKTMVKANDKDYDTTGNGVLTQVFVDTGVGTTRGEITIVSIDTFLAEATGDYNAKKESLSVKIYANTSSGDFGHDNTIKLDEISNIEDAKKDDRFLVQVAWNDVDEYEIVNMMDVESLSDVKLTKYSSNKYVVGGGNQYDYALDGKLANSLNEIDTYGTKALVDFTYNLYFDQYGYLVGNEVYSGEKHYVFIAGYDLDGSHLATAEAKASAIFLDGTMQNIQVNVSDTNDNIDAYNTKADTNAKFYAKLDAGLEQYNAWFTYTTETKNGATTYTLTPAENWMEVEAPTTATPQKIRTSNMVLKQTFGLKGNTASVKGSAGTRAYGNDESVYITVETGAVSAGTPKKGFTKVTGTYTGVQNVDLNLWATDGTAPTKNELAAKTNTSHTGTDGFGATNNKISGVFAVYDDDLYIIGAIVVGEDNTNSNNYGYVLKDARNEYIDEDDNHYWDFEAVVDGEIKTLTMKVSPSKYSSEVANFIALCGVGKNGLAQITYDKDGYVTHLAQQDDSAAGGSDKVYGQKDYTVDIDPDVHKVYTVKYDAGNTTNSGEPLKGSFKEIGRSLYNDNAVYNKTGSYDAGLPLATGAPVIVVREEQYTGGGSEAKYEDYTTIEQALNAMDTHKTNFEGWVSAVLDDRGAAKFIVINDKNAYSVTNDNGPNGDNDDITIEGVREEIITTPSSSNTADDQIKAMPDGAFTLPDADDSKMKDTVNGGLAGGLNANTHIKDVMFFKFTKPTGTQANTSVFVITIVSKDTGKIVWRDSMTCGAVATGGAFFYAQVSDSNSSVFYNSGTGPLATAPLAAGEYTWTITMDGATVTTDDFTINN